MVRPPSPISPSLSLGRSQSFDVDYNYNPTVLFKLVESKQWKIAKERVEDYPDEAAGWVTRHGKDGKLRWKLLPLHAVLCIKAPKDLVILIIQAFPDACALVDDQGMLPLHLAMKDPNIDEQVIKILLQVNPAAVNAKDMKGRIPLAMKGRPVLHLMYMAQELEKKKIRTEEKKVFESRLCEEQVSKTNDIRKLEEEVKRLSHVKEVNHRQNSELRLTSSQVRNLERELEKCKQIEEINEEQHTKISSQQNQLETKEEQLQSAMAKLACQEEYIIKYREMNKNDASELGTALGHINDLKTTVHYQEQQIVKLINQVKSQETARHQKRVVEDAKAMELEKLDDSLFVLKAQLDAQEAELRRKKDECKVSAETIKSFQGELEKVRETCKTREVQVDLLENRLDGVGAVNNNYRLSLEKMTMYVKEIVDQFKDLSTDHDDTVQALLNYEEMLENNNNNRENLILSILDHERKMSESESEERKTVMDLILQHKKKINLAYTSLGNNESDDTNAQASKPVSRPTTNQRPPPPPSAPPARHTNVSMSTVSYNKTTKNLVVKKS